MDCQTFAASWGHKFVGNWIVALQRKTIDSAVNVRGDVNSCVRV